MFVRLAVAGMALVAAVSQAAPLPAGAAGMDGGAVPSVFSTPSHNIECVFTPRGGSRVATTSTGLAELSCDRAQPVYLRVVMGERGRVVVIRNPGEQQCCTTDNQLPHGNSWQGGGFRCVSAVTGLRCERPDGHGFTISRAATSVF